MSTYKVLQDIEAEDKLLGPLSLRQFVYAIIVLVSLFLSYRLAVAGAWFLAIPFLPIIAFFGLLAAPFGHDQSNEVWLLAKIRFSLKPRKRIWDQSGIKELVTITVPKKIEKKLTKDFDKDEAKNRLKALANTLDSRGWAIKNVGDPSALYQPVVAFSQASGDRLIDSQMTIPTVVDDNTGFDILDYYDNPTIGNVDNLINNSEIARQQQIANLMRQNQMTASTTAQVSTNSNQQNLATTGDSNQTTWFSDGQRGQPQAQQSQTTPTLVSNPGGDTALPAQTIAQDITGQPQQPQQPVEQINPTPAPAPQSTSDNSVNPGIIELANNDDLDVATIARQADKAVKRSDDENEVVISLR